LQKENKGTYEEKRRRKKKKPTQFVPLQLSHSLENLTNAKLASQTTRRYSSIPSVKLMLGTIR
jgi:hypothetical protein